MTNKIKTLADLKEILATLTEDQLQQPGTILIEDSPHEFISGLEVINSPWLYNRSDSDDQGTFEDLKQLHGEEFIEEEYAIMFPEGMVVLYLTSEKPL